MKAVPRISVSPVDRLARGQAVRDFDRSAARRCRTPACPPWHPAAPSGAPSRTSSRSARCAAGEASMPPITIGTSRNASRTRCEYTITDRSGRLPPAPSGRVGIVAAHAPVRGVAVHHRVHVAGGHAEEQVGPAERGEGLGAVPVRLGDDADAEALGLQHPADDRHAEARDGRRRHPRSPRSRRTNPIRAASISARDMGRNGAVPKRAAQ